MAGNRSRVQDAAILGDHQFKYSNAPDVDVVTHPVWLHLDVLHLSAHCISVKQIMAAGCTSAHSHCRTSCGNAALPDKINMFFLDTKQLAAGLSVIRIFRQPQNDNFPWSDENCSAWPVSILGVLTILRSTILALQRARLG